MEITTQQLSKSQLELKIEIPASEFQGFIEKATLDLGQEIEIEGFRKGKAPREIIEKEVGEQRILQTAAEACVRENYLKAVSEQKLEPLGQPEIEILKLAPHNPFEFKAKIALLPEIELSDYRRIASQVKQQEVKVTDEEIERLKQEKERVEKEKLRQEILEKIAQASQLETPAILIESEKKRMLENIKEQVPQMLGISFEDYLKKINKTEKELLDSFSTEAEKRVRNSLILREIGKREKIEVQEQELETEMAKIAQLSPNLDKNQLKEYTESVIKNEKTFQILEGLTKS